MAGQEYKARRKKVQKMSREGLLEKDLTDGKSRSISHREDVPPRIRSPEQRAGQPADDAAVDKNIKKKKRRMYAQHRAAEQNIHTPEEKRRLRTSEKRAGETGAEEQTVRSPQKEKQKKQIKKKQMQENRTGQEQTGVSQKLPKELRTDSTQKNRTAGDGRSLSESSGRMEHYKGTPISHRGDADKESADDFHKRKKKLVHEDAEKRTTEKAAVSGETVRRTEKKPGRLSFEEEETSFSGGTGSGQGRKIVRTTGTALKSGVRDRTKEADADNTALEGAADTEAAAEHMLHTLKEMQERRKKMAPYSRRTEQAEAGRQGLRFRVSESGKPPEKESAEAVRKKKARIRLFLQKRRIREAYAAEKEGKKMAQGVKTAQSIMVRAKQAAKEIFRRNSGLLIGLGIFGLLFAVLAASLGSCAAGIQGYGTTFVGTTYASADGDIYAVENAYAALEAALNDQINSMEDRHEGYEEYRYNIDEISHNPYHLISYFTVKYGEFTYEQVEAELQEIFEEQYGITTHAQQDTVTETTTVRVGQSLGTVVTSGYCNCSICCGQWAGGPTASGAYPTPKHTIAVDAGSPFVPMGTKVIMNGVEYTVEDTGAFDRYGVQFDVYYGSHAEASAHGHQTWEAFIADDNGSREVEVTRTQEVNRLDVTLTNHSLDAVLRNRLNAEEEKRYDLYNHTYGNRSYLFDVDSLPFTGSGEGGFGYEIPSEALSDERFANMIHEAEKYLGYPYVWGGSSPETSFDCSGFVSWVINNCGNGWNIGRQTTNGLLGQCAQVPPSQAKPGDLVFFQGTYDTEGSSHVGIYVGSGMMIHCGEPIKYTSIETPYWQQHFMAFGRLP